MKIVSKVIEGKIIFHEKNDETKTVELKDLAGKLFSSLSFVYETKEEEIKEKGFFSRFSKKKIKKAEEKEVQISKGELNLNGDVVTIGCNDKEVWREVKNHNEEVLIKRRFFSLVFPYRFILHKGNIKEIVFN
jgi:hypothetical protein